MKLSDSDILLRLEAGDTIDSVAFEAGCTRGDIYRWWTAQVESRLPNVSGARTTTVTSGVDIVRDEWGIPHIYASNDGDLFFAYGYAMAQDRLWQLDYFRRKACGRLAEVLGPKAIEQDVIARTVGLNRIAPQKLAYMASETKELLEAFGRGINALMSESDQNLPIEFDLLGYKPEPWTSLDSVAIWCEFQWYLTGRLPVIAIPELAKRTLGEGALYQAFMTGEAEQESIIPPGSYTSVKRPFETYGNGIGGPEEGAGSNNWVIAGQHSFSGTPMVASDPHIAFWSTSFWYEVHLTGGNFNVAGTGYVGVPGLIFGRNQRVAWGLTNNICAQRDLYLEKTDSDHPGMFLFNGKSEKSQTVTEEICVRGSESVTRTVRFSRNGPIINELLPSECQTEDPVSLKWVGTTMSDEITSLLAYNRAGNCEEFRSALKDWVTPTFSFGFADVDGHIGYQAAGRIPIKNGWDRAYRHGWEHKDQWSDVIPFDDMPALSDPTKGWIRSANNRTAPSDFPYPLAGVWSSGYRAMRIREMIEERDKHSINDFARMQIDTLSLRAVESVQNLVSILSTSNDPRVRAAASHLVVWDRRMDSDKVGASIFEFFFDHWCKTVAQERFDQDVVPLVANAISGLSVSLLCQDKVEWFVDGGRDRAVISAFNQTLDELENRLGKDMALWEWGKLHTIQLDHYLSGRGDLGELLNRGGDAVGGNGITVCNTGHDPNYLASIGATYRLMVDLGESPPALWAVDAAGQSGHPGSDHYCDQVGMWTAGSHHRIPLDRSELKVSTTLVLSPSD